VDAGTAKELPDEEGDDDETKILDRTRRPRRAGDTLVSAVEALACLSDEEQARVKKLAAEAGGSLEEMAVRVLHSRHEEVQRLAAEAGVTYEQMVAWLAQIKPGDWN